MRWRSSTGALDSRVIVYSSGLHQPALCAAAPLTAFIWLWHLEQRGQAFRLASHFRCLGLFLSLNLITQGGFT